jgi:hypothetical protein
LFFGHPLSEASGWQLTQNSPALSVSVPVMASVKCSPLSSEAEKDVCTDTSTWYVGYRPLPSTCLSYVLRETWPEIEHFTLLAGAIYYLEVHLYK